MSEQRIDLAGFVEGCRGRSFRDFVWHHQEKRHAPDRELSRKGLEQALPVEALRSAQALVDSCRRDARNLEKDCGETAEELFRAIRSQRPDIEDGHALDAFTYAGLVLVEETRIRGANYWAVYVAMLIGGLVLANVSNQPALLIVGWILAGFGGLSIFGVVGKPR